MNNVNLIGRLTRDPELRDAGTTKVCKLRLAIPRRRQNGEDRGAVFVDVTTFGVQAENCARYLVQGRQVAVSGRLEYGEWRDDAGGPRSRHEVIADEVGFLGAPPSQPPEPAPADAATAA